MRPRHPAYRAYLRRMAAAALLYLVAIFVAVRLLHSQTLPAALGVAVALLPGVAVLLMLLGIARLLVELDDEYLRLLEVRKALVATGLTLAVTSVWGLLEMVPWVPRLEVFWVFPLWCMGLLVGQLVNRVTLGDGGCA